jgi:hypothetical protein
MTDEPTLADILAQIAKDPNELLRVLKEMDVKADQHITRDELVSWISKNAKDLTIRWQNADGTNSERKLADDFKALGETALSYKAFEAQRFADIKKFGDNAIINPTHHYEGKGTEADAKGNLKILSDELQFIAEKLQSSADDNRMYAEGASQRPSSEEIEAEKEFQQDIKERRAGAERIRKTNPKMAADIDKSIKEDLEEHRKEQAEKGIVLDSPEVIKIRAEAGKYMVDDAGNADLGQLSKVVAAAGGIVPAQIKGRE